MEKYAVVFGTVPNKYGDLGVVPVPCSEDGTPDPGSPYIKSNFHLYPTREEAEQALTAFKERCRWARRESELLSRNAPLGNDGAKYQSRPFDKDAQRFWRD